MAEPLPEFSRPLQIPKITLSFFARLKPELVDILDADLSELFEDLYFFSLPLFSSVFLTEEDVIGREAPQLVQNFAESSFSAPQEGQNTIGNFNFKKYNTEKN